MRIKESLREGNVRIPSGCAIVGIMDKSGYRHDGTDVIKAVSLMHDRSNGLGGGFAAYGIYPDYKDLYAFHIMYESRDAQLAVEEYLGTYFVSEKQERILTDSVPSIKDAPDTWRYFLSPQIMQLELSGLDEDEYTMQHVFHINTSIPGAFVASSGKDMGVFKGVGYPEDIGEFYRLPDYKAWAWTGHGRFPTNTPGWWAGAHPFTLLDWSVVHNGEISSYDTNRRYVEQYGYDCALMTDTEVITYLFDLLVRRHGFTQEMAAHIMTATAWENIDQLPGEVADFESALRIVYSSALVNGPFSIIVGSSEGLLALNDRLKLRALMVGEKDSMVYLASEQAAIELICPDVQSIRSLEGGVPYVAQLDEVANRKQESFGDSRLSSIYHTDSSYIHNNLKQHEYVGRRV
ncbi:MAG: glutamine amidotransferase family protein [Eggerthellaceae bacterium]|nr:glutamine amidotransferase family protein [Eggerthellaceae bacterium]